VRVTVAPGVNDRDFTLMVDAEKTMRCGNRFERIDCHFQSAIRAIFKAQSIGQIRYAFLETVKRKSAEKLALNLISRGIRRYRRNFMAGPC